MTAIGKERMKALLEDWHTFYEEVKVRFIEESDTDGKR